MLVGPNLNHFNVSNRLIIFLFSGILFPVSVLPDMLKPISNFVPVTHGLEMMRKILIFDSHEFWSFSAASYLLLWSVIMFYFGSISLKKAIELSRVSGNLGKY